MTKLHIRVVEATDIEKMDANATDAYCLLSCGTCKGKTRVIDNNMHPVWNEEFHFVLASPTSGSLNILMRDKDLTKDDDMATLEIQAASLQMGQVLDQWYDMIPCKKVKKGGRLHLVTHLSGADDAPFVTKQKAPEVPQQGYGAPPPGYPQPGYGAPGYPQPGYPQPGYGAPGYPQPGYPQPGYGAPPPGYGAPPPGYGAPPPGYGAPPPGYGAPPPGYGAPPPGYGAPPGPYRY